MANTTKTILICIICAATLLSGCLDSDVHIKESTEIIETAPNEIIVVEEIASPTTEMTPTAIPTPTPAPAVPTEINLSMGETATDSRVEITVTSMHKKYYYDYYGYGYAFSEEAAQGNTFVFATINIKNIGSERSYQGASEFSVTDSNGYRYDSEILYMGDDKMEYFQELYQNQQMEGTVVFEVPKDATGLKIQYDFGNIFGRTQIASWSID